MNGAEMMRNWTGAPLSENMGWLENMHQDFPFRRDPVREVDEEQA
jgi:hypothetical protein